MNSNNKNQNKNNAVFDSGCSNSSKKLITVLSTIMHYKNIQNNDNNYYISWKLKKYINKKLQELNPHSKNIELALNFLKRNSSKQLNIIDNSMAIKKVCNKLKNFDTIAQNNKINKKVYKPRYYKLLVIKHIIEENNNIKKRDKKHLLKNIDRKNTNISTENENSVSSIDNNSKCSSLLYTNQDLQSWYLEKHNNRLQTPKK